jgi:hypothetical protein
LEELKNELHSLRSKYENLQQKYASLNLLYMEHVHLNGSLRCAASAGSTGTTGTEMGAPKNAFQEEGNAASRLFELQQSDVAAWLSATSQMNLNHDFRRS